MDNIYKVFLDLLQAINELDRNCLNRLLHPHTTFEFPYALSMPNIITGRNEVINYLLNRKFSCTYLTPLYLESTDSGIVISEVLSEETFFRTGKTYQQHVVFRVKVTEDLIESYREFFNPILRLEGLLNLDIDNLDHLDG